MALDPSIALGVKPLELANPLAQYGQMAQLQNYQNQNALAQYQLGAAQRAEQTATTQNELYAKHFNPATGGLDVNALIGEAAQRGQGGIIPNILKSENERQKAAADLYHVKTQTEAAQFKLANDKLKHGLESLTSAPTPQDAIEKLNDGVTKGFFDMKTASAEAKKLQNMTPQDYQKYRIEKILGLVDDKDRLTAMLPKIKYQEAGGSILGIQDNPTMPGYGLPVPGMAIKKTATPGERTAQGQLSLAQQKFAWEKANPGQTIHEDANGLLAVNNRTGVATPVVYGPMGIQPAGAQTAPATAPGTSMMRQPPAALPGQRTSAIPGMASVLDQTNAPAMPMPAEGGVRVPGMPVGGKDKALTESQGNATAYGMRMKEANSILNPLEKAGVKNTGLISGVVGSTLGVVPYLGDKLEGMSGSVFNALPQILGGLSPEQQQVAQARINFITAVLRKESGASISPSEFVTAEKNYFPKPGDDQTVVAQKQKARDLAIKSMGIQAGPGAKHIEQYVPSGGAAAPTVSNW